MRSIDHSSQVCSDDCGQEAETTGTASAPALASLPSSPDQYLGLMDTGLQYADSRIGGPRADGLERECTRRSGRLDRL